MHNYFPCGNSILKRLKVSNSAIYMQRILRGRALKMFKHLSAEPRQLRKKQILKDFLIQFLNEQFN